MELMIISDGTIEGTTLIDPKTNKTIDNCTRIEFTADANEALCQAKIFLTDIPICLTAKDIKTDPPETLIHNIPEKYRGQGAGS